MKRYSYLILILAFLFTSCGFINSRLGIKDCSFKLKSVKIGSLDFKGVKLVAEISVKNPNKQDVVIDRFDFRLSIEEDELFNGNNELKTRIAGNTTGSVELNIKIPYKDFTPVLDRIKSGEELNYILDGIVYLDTSAGQIKIPVKVEKKMKIEL